MKNIFAVALVALSLGGLGTVAHAADLTRIVTVVENGQNKHYLGTQFGQTLYTFDMDSATASACNQACAEKWPPLLVSPAEAANLVAPYATIKRSSALLQVTFNGKPIYTYFLDHAEGDDKGDDVGGVWHDIDAT